MLLYDLRVAGVGQEKTVRVSTVMTSTNVLVTGPVWEPISVGVRPAGTVAHVRSPTAGDFGVVSRVSKRQDAVGATRGRHVCRELPPIPVSAPATRGSSTNASHLESPVVAHRRYRC